MQPSQIYGDLDHTLLIRFKKTVFQVCFVLLGIGIPLLMTLVTFTVDRLKLFRTVPGVGDEGSCFLTIIGAKVHADTFILKKNN